MPTSDPILLTPVAKEILSIQPSSILDIGVGFGKFGVLSREYTDVWNRRKDYEYKTVIHGIEVFEKYRNSNWAVYDKIFVGNVIDILPTLGFYDLILLIEGLEHFSKNNGLFLIEKCLTKCKVFIFSFTNSEQGEVFENTYEKHVSTWNNEDFTLFKMKKLYYNGIKSLYKVVV